MLENIQLYLILIAALIPVLIGFLYLFDKDRPEGLLGRIIGSLIWIIIPLIILYIFFPWDLIKFF
tara:strand:+ start:87 stop:281 length:195 start_codon:yes stop_codon:yes gene_type:complete